MLRWTTSLVHYGFFNTLPFAAKMIKADFSEAGEGAIIDKLKKTKENIGVSVRIELGPGTSHINVGFPPPHFIYSQT